jgi:hypothetical protein
MDVQSDSIFVESAFLWEKGARKVFETMSNLLWVEVEAIESEGATGFRPF